MKYEDLLDIVKSGEGYTIEFKRSLDNINHEKVEITNPGRLMFPKEELGNRAVHRNPILVDTAHRVGLIEKAGSGIKRIKKMIADNESEVIFETGEFFSTIFLREQKESVQVIPKDTSTNKEIGANGEKKSSPMILELISKNPKITTEEMIKATKLTRRGIEYQLAKLKQEGIIKREGSRKTGYWVIIRKTVE